MKRTLYHGSENIIEKPQYGLGNIHNDYGLGFYCCNSKKIAREWASRKHGFGFVNEYKLRDDEWASHGQSAKPPAACPGSSPADCPPLPTAASPPVSPNKTARSSPHGSIEARPPASPPP